MSNFHRQASLRLLVSASLAGAILVCGAPAFADPLAPCNDGTGTGSTECGTNSTTGTAASATAVGNSASATGEASVAVGADTTFDDDTTGAVASALGTTAVGADAKATAQGGTAYGALSEANAEGAVAVGAVARRWLQSDMLETLSVWETGWTAKYSEAVRTR